MERSQDWLKQAERDLQHARHSLKLGDYEWACFAAQQTAEKALKAVYEKMNKTVKGHSIVGLLGGLQEVYPIPKEFDSLAKVLSRYYIETRYPSGFPEGSPSDYFNEDIAMEAVNAAEKILKWCGNCISGNK